MTDRFDPFKICRNLRCKEMVAGGDNSEWLAMGLFDPYDATAYWCNCTQTGRGPDGERVHLEHCSLGTERTCFVGIDSLV